jgi:hypothetical protein
MSPRLRSIRNQQRHTFSKKDRPRFPALRLSRTRAALGLFVLVVALGSAYLGLLNDTSVDGFALKEREQRIADLQRQNDRLVFEASERSSLGQIEQYAAAQEMVQVGRIEHLPTAGSAVAAR